MLNSSEWRDANAEFVGPADIDGFVILVTLALFALGMKFGPPIILVVVPLLGLDFYSRHQMRMSIWMMVRHFLTRMRGGLTLRRPIYRRQQ